MTDPRLDALAASLGLEAPFASIGPYRRIAAAIAGRQRATGTSLLVGICGPQGSGKSTMASFLQAMLTADCLPTAVLSLDDLYLDAADRPIDIHPLFATRGVPGTHDVALGLSVIDRLFATGGAIPRFDKARDRRHAEAAWDVFPGPARVVLFEGWCVGASPQDLEALSRPVNLLEAEEDAEGRWREHANHLLDGPYRQLFERIGFLIYLRAPSFDCVFEWRGLQERKLRAGRGAGAGMDGAALARFVRHYERITRHLAETLPARADIVVDLDPSQRIVHLVASDNDIH